ncbi:MAG: DNA-binding domain-containing protein [Rhodospirillales bacterium]
MWHETMKEFDAALTDPVRPVPAMIEDSAARFNVYRNNIAVSLPDALAETFPVTRRLVGDEFFYGVAQTYVLKNRPSSPVLSEYGNTFPAFLSTLSTLEDYPYLSGVARLERLWLDAYHAADANPIGIDALARVPEDDLDDLTFVLHPSLRLIQSDMAAISIWLAHQDTDSPDLSGIVHRCEQALILRPALEVRVVPVDAAAFEFTACLAAGTSLGAACDARADDPDFDPSRHLADLFNAGAVIALGDVYNHGGGNVT